MIVGKRRKINKKETEDGSLKKQIGSNNNGTYIRTVMGEFYFTATEFICVIHKQDNRTEKTILV